MKEDFLELLIGIVVFAIIIIANLVNLAKRRGKGFDWSALFNGGEAVRPAEDGGATRPPEASAGDQARMSEEARKFFQQYRQENSEQFFGTAEFDEAEEEARFGYADSPVLPSPKPASPPLRSSNNTPLPETSGDYARRLRNNPRYAIVMHEILGRPRSEVWK